ncbi:hypothetical protein MSIMFI_05515 [Mycobacterium simulans]|nr:hypothetical protein MSIMFI_05515 [Mycobacterium simulans]
MPGQPARQRGSAQHHQRCGIVEHERDPRRRVPGIDRQIRRPRFEHRQDRDDRLRGALHQQPHHIAGTHPVTNQQVRQPIRGLIQLPIAVGLPLKHQRNRVRRTPHLSGKQHRNRHRSRRRGTQRGLVTPHLQIGALGGIEHIDRRQPPIRIGGHRHQNLAQPPHQRLNAGRVEHIGAVLHHPADPVGRTSVGEAFSQRKRQIHPRGVGIHRHRGGLQTIRHHPGAKIVVLTSEVLPGQHHLNQRMMGHAPDRVEPIHHHLKGHILMLQRGQTARAHLGQQFSKTHIAIDLHPQHQRIDEKAHHLIQRRLTTTRHRKTHRHITGGSHHRQQRTQRGLHHHETGRIMGPSHPCHLLMQLRRPLHHNPRTAMISHRRVGPIGGQLKTFRHACQRANPIAQLSTSSALAIGEFTQIGALPQRVIDVLHRQRHPTRGPADTPAGISHPQIRGQRAQRPAIRGDMVHHQHQHMLLLSHPQQLGPQRDLARQIETVPRLLLDRLLQLRPRPTPSIDDLPTEIRPLHRHDHLLSYPIDSHKHRAQTLMTTHHIGHRRAQRITIKAPTQPQRPR